MSYSFFILFKAGIQQIFVELNWIGTAINTPPRHLLLRAPQFQDNCYWLGLSLSRFSGLFSSAGNKIKQKK